MERVLVVTDDDKVYQGIRPLLEELGCEPSQAGPRDLEKTVADAEPHLVIVDADCQRDAGPAAAAWVHQRLGLPVLMLATSVDTIILESTAHVAPTAFVLKPVERRELAAAMHVAAFRRGTMRGAQAAEHLYETTLRSIGDAVITADETGTITFINPVAEAITGWTATEALGRSLETCFSVEPESSHTGLADEERPVLRLKRRDGSERIVEHQAAPIVEESGDLFGVVTIFRDITERRRIEQRLALSDRMASIGTLAAGVAHELNNPLAFVTSNLHFAIGELNALQASGEVPDPEDLADIISSLKEATDGAARAAQIVKEMKVFMRAEGDPQVPVDVNQAVTFALRVAGNEIRHRATLETRLVPVAPVLADEGKLVQVFVSLLTNAVQAIEDKPSDSRITVTSGVEGGRVVLRVQDTGRGIPPAHIGRVFEPFFTTQPVGKGVGLGLSVAHSIVTGIGGTISIDSVVGRGTTVTVSLPASEQPRATLQRTRDSKRKTSGRILVIDDETLIGTAIRRILTKHGFDVTVEDQGRAGFDRIASGERYDVILCDLMMAGFSGVDFYEALDEVAPDAKSRVVFMTGNAFTPRAQQLFENTENVRLDKPFVPDDLTRVVTEVMRRHQGAEPASPTVQ